jgi:hypothetical protein
VLEQGDEFDAETRKNIATGFCADEHAWFDVVAAFLSDGFDTVYDGIGGDVLSAGLYLTPGRIEQQKASRYQALAEDFLIPRYAATLSRLLTRESRIALSRAAARERIAAELATHADAANPIGSFCFWNRTRREVALAPYAMGPAAATVYAPFLDRDLYDLLASLPAETQLDRSFHTDAITRAFPLHAGLAFERKGGKIRSGRTQDRVFSAALLRSRRLQENRTHPLLAPGVERRLRRALATDGLRFRRARLDPRLALYLCQRGEAVDA